MSSGVPDGAVPARLPENEAQRLAELYSYGILDTPPELEFDDATALAAQICGTPIALITLLDHDRQWFKSHLGLEITQTPRAVAFCDYAILDPAHPTIVPDAAEDERFRNNPLVTGDPMIRFYAGAPLVTQSGSAMGTLCVIDQSPRHLTPQQIDALSALARQVVAQMELRRHVDLLHQSEGLLAEVIDKSADAVVLASLTGEILRFNRSAERIFGRAASDVVGELLTELMPEEFREAHQAGLLRLASSGTGQVLGKWLRLRGLRADGTQFPLDLHVSEVGGIANRERTFVGVMRDATETDATQRMREDLLSSISHELRTPLASSTLFLDLARSEPRTPRNVRDHLDVISRNIRRLDRLVDDLLLVSSRESGSFPIVLMTVDIPAALRESIAAATAGAESANKRIALDAQLGPAMEGDAGRLGQVFDNLLSNALKFSPVGGVASVRCEVVDGQWVVAFHNRGTPVDPAEIEHLTEPFMRGRNALAADLEGMGLGLTIAATIVRRHGGSIDVSSSHDEGTTVTVRLPLVAGRRQ